MFINIVIRDASVNLIFILLFAISPFCANLKTEMDAATASPINCVISAYTHAFFNVKMSCHCQLYLNSLYLFDHINYIAGVETIFPDVLSCQTSIFSKKGFK